MLPIVLMPQAPKLRHQKPLPCVQTDPEGQQGKSLKRPVRYVSGNWAASTESVVLSSCLSCESRLRVTQSKKMWALSSLHLSDVDIGSAHQGGLDSHWLPWEPNAGCAWGRTGLQLVRELLWSALGNSLPLVTR